MPRLPRPQRFKSGEDPARQLNELSDDLQAYLQDLGALYAKVRQLESVADASLDADPSDLLFRWNETDTSQFSYRLAHNFSGSPTLTVVENNLGRKRLRFEEGNISGITLVGTAIWYLVCPPLPPRYVIRWRMTRTVTTGDIQGGVVLACNGKSTGAAFGVSFTADTDEPVMEARLIESGAATAVEHDLVTVTPTGAEPGFLYEVEIDTLSPAGSQPRFGGQLTTYGTSLAQDTFADSDLTATTPWTGERLDRAGLCLHIVNSTAAPNWQIDMWDIEVRRAPMDSR